MPATETMSVEEYLRTSSKPAFEYTDGVLRQKSMPTKLHSILQVVLGLLLRKQGWDALHEVLVRLTETRFRVPDLIADRHIEEPYPTRPVTLCIEILSPGDRLSEVLAKCEDYHAWGVPYCWVIDPVRETAWEYHVETSFREVGRGEALTAGEIRVNLEELFAEVQRLR